MRKTSKSSHHRGCGFPAPADLASRVRWRFGTAGSDWPTTSVEPKIDGLKACPVRRSFRPPHDAFGAVRRTEGIVGHRSNGRTGLASLSVVAPLGQARRRRIQTTQEDPRERDSLARPRFQHPTPQRDLVPPNVATTGILANSATKRSGGGAVRHSCFGRGSKFASLASETRTILPVLAST
jgi:hypothetical protein